MHERTYEVTLKFVVETENFFPTRQEIESALRDILDQTPEYLEPGRFADAAVVAELI